MSTIVLRKKRRHKYGAKRTEVDGIKFDSKKEAIRYRELKLMMYVGEIDDLKIHPRYPLIVNGTKICDYIADFEYIRDYGRQKVVEDTKGVKTDVYRLKKKLFELLYGIKILES